MPPTNAPLSDRLATAKPYALSLFRIVVGLLFACHGAAALFGILGGAGGSGDTVAAGTWPGWYAAAIQFVGGILVLLGIGSRTAALISSGSMAYAYFSTHAPEGLWPLLNGGEAAAMFCWAFLLLVFTGPGPLALDRVLARSRQEAPTTAQQREPSAIG